MFVREAAWREDALNPGRVVIGECCREHGDLLESLYRPLGAPIYRVDPTTSELIKLVTNALRALSITFWNQVAELAERIGADVRAAAEAADPGKVLGLWEGGRWGTRFFRRPYGGRCLPKDVRHLIEAFREAGVDPSLLEAAELYNAHVR